MHISAPARDAIQFEKQVFYSHLDNNPFVGPPRPALDDAWHQLLKSMLASNQLFTHSDHFRYAHSVIGGGDEKAWGKKLTTC